MSAVTAGVVVVGVDGTEDGDRAVWYGTALARRERLELRLVHVPHDITVYGPMMPYLPSDTVREIGDTVLRDAAKHAEEAGMDAERTTTLIADGPRNAALVRQLGDARCIVLGSRDSALQHLLTGATTMAVVAHSPVPVFCVPRAWTQSAGPTGRVVTGMDGPAADDVVLQAAFSEAAARGARLEIVHAWQPVSPYDVAIGNRVLREQWETAARAALSPVVEAAAAAHPGVEWTLELRFERVVVALHELASGADLLVLGRHGHNGPLGLFIGSNTRTLVHRSTCPVVVVPTHSTIKSER